MNSKKKGLVIALLLMVVGFVSYGAYSYFWAEGSFSAPSNEGLASSDEGLDYNAENIIRFVGQRFTPNASYTDDLDDGYEFLGTANGSLVVSCSEVDNDGYSYCSGSRYVINAGTTCILVTVSEAGMYSEQGSQGSVSLNWNEKYLAPNQNAKLTASGSVYYGDSVQSSEAVKVTAPVGGVDDEVSMHYELTATQVEDHYCNN